jgi:hypothetical protein
MALVAGARKSHEIDIALPIFPWQDRLIPSD